ncbi:MAG: hypothetical protein ACRCTE_01900 [Cellulosilyticaceae bacterium]
MSKIEKVLQGGSNSSRNIIVGLMLGCLVCFGLVAGAALNGQIEENIPLALGLCVGGSIVAIFTIIYVLYHHGAYRKRLKMKYGALTGEALEQMARDLANYTDGDLVVFGEHRLYGSFAVLGKLFTKSFTWIDYDTIVWAYEKRETYVLPHYRNNPAIKNSLIIRDNKGNSYEIDCRKQYYKEELAELKRLGKQCIIGYSKEKKQTYAREPGYFYDRYRSNN